MLLTPASKALLLEYFMGLSGMCIITAFGLLAHPKVVLFMLANRRSAVATRCLCPTCLLSLPSWSLEYFGGSRVGFYPGRGWVITASALNILVFLALSLLYSHTKGASVFWAARSGRNYDQDTDWLIRLNRELH